MSKHDKTKNGVQNIEEKIKEAERTKSGNRNRVASGQNYQMKGDLTQAGETVKDALKEWVDSSNHQREGSYVHSKIRLVAERLEGSPHHRWATPARWRHPTYVAHAVKSRTERDASPKQK